MWPLRNRIFNCLSPSTQNQRRHDPYEAICKATHRGCTACFFGHTCIPSHAKAREAISKTTSHEVKMDVYSDLISYLQAQKPPMGAGDADYLLITDNTLRGIQGSHNLYSAYITRPTLGPPTCYSPNMPFPSLCAFAHAVSHSSPSTPTSPNPI